MNTKKKGFIIAFVGPSASGKTEIVKRLVKNNDLFRRVVTATTRKPRQEKGTELIISFYLRISLMRREKKEILSRRRNMPVQGMALLPRSLSASTGGEGCPSHT